VAIPLLADGTGEGQLPTGYRNWGRKKTFRLPYKFCPKIDTLLIIGYGYRGSARDDVWSFDVEGKSWRREEGLTEGKGLRYHTATTVGEETVILGGYLSGQGENGLSTKMFIFRMSPK
jgi:hypothetical protein